MRLWRAGWLGSDMSHFKHCYRRTPNGRGVTPILSEVSAAAAIIRLSRANSEAHLCIFPEVLLKLFLGWWWWWCLQTPLRDSLDRSGLSSQENKHERNTSQMSGCSQMLTSPRGLCLQLFPIASLFHALPSFLPLKHPLGWERGRRELIYKHVFCTWHNADVITLR